MFTGPEVFSFPFFTEEFCDRFTAELDHIKGSPVPKGRPNTMNNYGVSYTYNMIIANSLAVTMVTRAQ